MRQWLVLTVALRVGPWVWLPIPRAAATAEKCPILQGLQQRLLRQQPPRFVLAQGSHHRCLRQPAASVGVSSVIQTVAALGVVHHHHASARGGHDHDDGQWVAPRPHLHLHGPLGLQPGADARLASSSGPPRAPLGPGAPLLRPEGPPQMQCQQRHQQSQQQWLRRPPLCQSHPPPSPPSPASHQTSSGCCRVAPPALQI
mmetsp:Transcript_57863/g.150795  ORF Transcript_57863/g.150795 Transcript_57863/m.150795 type:complete len:200 (+) Transcript_57863:1598-2197(+)